jgi:hypothetical protein
MDLTRTVGASQLECDPVTANLRKFCEHAPAGKCHTLEEIAAGAGISTVQVHKDIQRILGKMRAALIDWAENASDEELAQLASRRSVTVQGRLFGVCEPVAQPTRRPAKTRRAPRLRLVADQTLDIPGLNEADDQNLPEAA